MLEPPAPPQAGDGPWSAHPYRAAVRAFGTVAEALGKVEDLDALLHLIAQQASKLAGARRCSVYLRDRESDLFLGQVGHPENVEDAEIKRLVAGVPADRFTQEIVESRRPVVVSNALDDPRTIRSTMRAWNVRSILGVPMVLRGQVIGIVFLDNDGESRAFSQADCEVASTFADLAAVAISQVRMTAELRSSVELAATQNRLLRRASATDERLSRLVLEGGDLSEIAVAVAELTRKPTSIHDARHRRLAVAMPPALEDDVAPRLLEPSYRDHPLVRDALVVAARLATKPRARRQAGGYPDAGNHREHEARRHAPGARADGVDGRAAGARPDRGHTWRHRRSAAGGGAAAALPRGRNYDA